MVCFVLVVVCFKFKYSPLGKTDIFAEQVIAEVIAEQLGHLRIVVLD